MKSLHNVSYRTFIPIGLGPAGVRFLILALASAALLGACRDKKAESAIQDSGPPEQPPRPVSNAPQSPLLYAVMMAGEDGQSANVSPARDGGSPGTTGAGRLIPPGFAADIPCLKDGQYRLMEMPENGLGKGTLRASCAAFLGAQDNAAVAQAPRWQLATTPDAFIWESGMADGQLALFEIRDSSRRPWPASMRRMKKADRLIAELRINEPLTPGEEFNVWVTFGADGGEKTYRSPLVVADGPSDPPSWKKREKRRNSRKRRGKKKRRKKGR
jgi:hypothetical protein